MTGSKVKLAARSWAGFVTEPQISREKAGEVLGHEIPAEAWQRIERAINVYGNSLQDLTATKASRKKGDPQGWLSRQTAATKALEAALDRLEAARSRHGEFLHEASENYSLQTFGYSAGPERSARRKIDQAFRLALDALIILDRAQPQNIEAPTAAAARDAAIREIYSALVESGIGVRVSSGYQLDALDRAVRLSDLTAFENLIVQLQIGDEKKPAAFAAFIRAALAGGNRG